MRRQLGLAPLRRPLILAPAPRTSGPLRPPSSPPRTFCPSNAPPVGLLVCSPAPDASVSLRVGLRPPPRSATALPSERTPPSCAGQPRHCLASATAVSLRRGLTDDPPRYYAYESPARRGRKMQTPRMELSPGGEPESHACSLKSNNRPREASTESFPPVHRALRSWDWKTLSSNSIADLLG